MDGIDRDERWLMSGPSLQTFVELLVAEFDVVIAPVVESGVIRLRQIESADDLPVGVTDEQEAGTYRLRPTGTRLRFSYSVGPDSLKSLVHPPRRPIWTMRRRDGSLIVESATPTEREVAVLGARACDVRGLAVLERTQTSGDHQDPDFVTRRRGLFVVVADCTHPAPTCFCGTAGAGPQLDDGFDIGLTELAAGRGAEYVVRVGSARGRALVERLGLRAATTDVLQRADRLMREADRSLVRELPADAAAAVSDPTHPQWSSVADRCLTCGNCTAVCPTCFCTDMEDAVALDGTSATRDRVWDSCFSLEYSHLGPGPHRASPMSRYRQWLTHKLGTWHDQFGESGCVGCGRCITWCPVGIDLTSEVEALGRGAGP